MVELLIFLFLVLLALAAPRWGTDSHRSGEWSPEGPTQTWCRPDPPKHTRQVRFRRPDRGGAARP